MYLEAIKQDKDVIDFIPEEMTIVHTAWRLMYE